jgi:hypothetical protein
MPEEIINRVAKSPLQTIDLEEYFHQGERVVFDLKDHLYEGLVLKEMDFRKFIKSNDWSEYEGKNIAITCSTDAIVPTWAYMLVASNLEPVAHMVVFGSLEVLENTLYKEALSKIDPREYKDAKVIIKGCSKYPVPVYAYVELVRLLRPYVSSLMYGEPCSTVPIYKKATTAK